MALSQQNHAPLLSMKSLDRYASYCLTKLAHSHRFFMYVLYIYMIMRVYARRSSADAEGSYDMP